MSGRPFTPATLAEHLGCSERLIRNEIAAGNIRAFRVGEKLLRIEPEAVEEYKCRNTGSPDFLIWPLRRARGGRLRSVAP